MSDESITVLKYKLNGKYHIEGFDKFTAEDEATRLDKVIEYSAGLEMTYGDQYKQLWIKTCPIFAI